MTQTKNNIDSHKGKHLSYAERCKIAVLKKENYTNRQVATVLNRAPQTINNEIKRGTITNLKRQVQKEKTYDYYTSIYDADAGQTFYEEQRMNCGRRPKWTDTDTFIEWADDKMLIEKWSPDVLIGFALKQELFDKSIIPCTSTLYQWIDRGVMRTKNMDLLEKLTRKIKLPKHGNPPNKRVLGVSIEKRPEIIDSRKTFGHWEIDTVVGRITKCDAVLLTLVERQTRFEVIFKLDGKDAKSVDKAIENLRKRSGDYFTKLFKTVTSDNGSEFSGLHEALQDAVDVYFSHPYASWERGTSENQHKLIRRFIPKGSPISNVSEEQLIRIQQWMNDYPRKILNYQTPHNCLAKAFREECLVA